jgi:hypothetical protein
MQTKAQLKREQDRLNQISGSGPSDSSLAGAFPTMARKSLLPVPKRPMAQRRSPNNPLALDALPEPAMPHVRLARVRKGRAGMQ